MTDKSKNVLLIKEENHGLIGVARNYKKAIKYLIDSNWLTEGVEIYDTKEGKWKSVEEVLGENWADIILNKWDIEVFNETFEGDFNISETELI